MKIHASFFSLVAFLVRSLSFIGYKTALLCRFAQICFFQLLSHVSIKNTDCRFEMSAFYIFMCYLCISHHWFFIIIYFCKKASFIISINDIFMHVCFFFSILVKITIYLSKKYVILFRKLYLLLLYRNNAIFILHVNQYFSFVL